MINQNNEKILIVDDSPVIREILTETISESFVVLAVKSGEESIKALETFHPHLVLLDIEMEGIDGYLTCRKIKEINPEVSVIFLSSHDSNEERLEAFDCGADDFIPKSTHNKVILRKIQVVLNNRRARAELAADKVAFEKMAMTFLDSMGECGVLLNYARRHIAIDDYEELAKGTLKSAINLGLDCNIQIRNPEGSLSTTLLGPASPLEESVLSQVSQMGRIFQFKNKLVANEGLVTIIVKNVPDDTELAGRTRDNIALLSGICNSFVNNITVRKENTASTRRLHDTNLSSETAVEGLRDKYREQLVEIRLQLETMVREVEKIFLPLGLTSAQEARVSNTLDLNSQRVLQKLDQQVELEELFSAALNALGPNRKV